MNNDKLPQNDELREHDGAAENRDSEQAYDNNSVSDDANQDTVPAVTDETETATESAEDGNGETLEDYTEDGARDTGEGTGEEQKAPKKRRTRIDTRRLRYGGMATAMTAAAVAVVVLVNIVAGILNDRFPIKLDLTADKLYTLSDDSREIAKSVKKDTVITVFGEQSTFSNPNTGEPNLDTVFKQFYEVTRQYDSLSGSKIKTTYVDLISSPALASKYSKYEVKEGDILFQCGTRWQKANVNELFTYNQESYYYYEQMTDATSEVEKVLASKISMVTSEYTPIVTVLTGHDEDSNVISGIESVIKSNNYETETLDITASGKFNEKSDFALIAAPKTDYSQAEIQKLRDWLNNEGKYNRSLAVAVNYDTDCPNLYEFLNVEYGIEVTDNLVVETEANKMYNYNSYFPIGDVNTSDFTEDIAGKRALMPVTRQLITHKENSKDNSLYNVDIITFEDSSRLVKLADAIKQTEDNSKEIEQVKADEYPVTGVAYATKWGYDSDNEQYKTNILVYGSQQALFADVMAFTSVENEGVLLSLFNGFTGNENTVTISSKPLDKERLEFTTGQANVFFLIFVVAIPLSLLAACLAIFIRRRRL